MMPELHRKSGRFFLNEKNTFEQWLHWKTFSLVWMFRCRCMFDFVEKPLWQMSHSNGFGCVLVHVCAFSSSFAKLWRHKNFPKSSLALLHHYNNVEIIDIFKSVFVLTVEALGTYVAAEWFHWVFDLVIVRLFFRQSTSKEKVCLVLHQNLQHGVE